MGLSLFHFLFILLARLRPPLHIIAGNNSCVLTCGLFCTVWQRYQQRMHRCYSVTFKDNHEEKKLRGKVQEAQKQTQT